MNDLISRQAAIDALHKTMLDFFKTNDDDKPEFITASEKMLLSVNKAISNALKKLPSAQRKVLKYTGESICLNCWTKNCDGCLFEPMEGVQ